MKLLALFVGVFFLAVELTPEDLREIESASSKIKIQGDRYPEKLEKMTGL
jgi:hypothetical protein